MGDFFGIGLMELLLILIVAVIALGPAKMAEVAKALGKLIGTVRRASTELTTQVTRELEEEKKAQPPSATGKNNDTL